MFDRSSRKEVTLEASREVAKPKTMLKPRKVKSLRSNCYYPSKWHLLIIFSNEQVCSGGKRKKDEISVDCLDFNKKILHTAWHPQVRLEANNLSLLLIFSQAQMFFYWWFLKPKYCRRTLSLSRPRTISSSSRFWLSSALLKMKTAAQYVIFPFSGELLVSATTSHLPSLHSEKRQWLCTGN